MVAVPAPRNARSHLVQQIGEVGDFRLTGAILEDGLALGESRGHQQVFGARDRDLVEANRSAFEAVGGGLHVAVVLRDLGAQALESVNVQIDRSGADGAAARQRDAGASATRHQRA